jgi:hypothetical protein
MAKGSAGRTAESAGGKAASFEAQGPVDWALGKVLVKTLLEPVVYAVWPDRVDPRDWMRACELPRFEAEPGQDFWFDFVADTADSDVGTYNIAYLFQGALRVSDPSLVAADEPRLGSRSVAVSPAAVLPAAVSPADASPPGEATASDGLLPRGAFLFVGGDTAYPVADVAQVEKRFRLPMEHAHAQRFANETRPEPRPLLGIPGNHDWYDNLDGFNRVFRSASAPLAGAPTDNGLGALSGYGTLQEASYFSLGLPGGWELWALDARDDDDVDHRQQVFFEAQARALKGGRKLLLATPTPPLVYGAVEPWAARFVASLPQPARHALRVWFSGDTHHYARYERAGLPTVHPFTSLVCGLGGAALHAPTEGGIQAACTYPAVDEAAASIGARLGAQLIHRVGMRRLGGILGACSAAGALQRTGEVGPRLDCLTGGSSCREALFPWCAVALVLTVIWLVWKLTRRPSEAEARKTPLRRRILRALIPFLVPLVALITVAYADRRTFGNVVLDFAFELASLLLLLGIPTLLILGLPKPRSGARVVLLGLAAELLGSVVLSISIVLALAVRRPLEALGQGALFAAACAVTAVVITFLVLSLAFPVAAGWVLRLALRLGSHRAFVSSFASVDQFTAFIRFRVRVSDKGSSLTGYVIAVDKPVSLESLRNPQSHAELVPTAKLVDVFTV